MKKQATRGILLLLWVKVNAMGITGCMSFPFLSPPVSMTVHVIIVRTVNTPE